MEQEPPQKLLCGHGHEPLLALVGIIFPAEGDHAIGKVDDPVVGDGDAMGVAGQVVEDMFRSSEWPFCIDHPVLTKQWPQKSKKGFLRGERLYAARKDQFSLVESALQTGYEFAAKDAAQYLHRQKKGVAWVNPALVIGG